MDKEIHRILVCGWAYGWDKDQTMHEVRKYLDEKAWESFIERKRQEEESLENLLIEIKSMKTDKFPLIALKESSTRGYGNKYIKRKHRH